MLLASGSGMITNNAAVRGYFSALIQRGGRAGQVTVHCTLYSAVQCCTGGARHSTPVHSTVRPASDISAWRAAHGVSFSEMRREWGLTLTLMLWPYPVTLHTTPWGPRPRPPGPWSARGPTSRRGWCRAPAARADLAPTTWAGTRASAASRWVSQSRAESPESPEKQFVRTCVEISSVVPE